MIGFMLLLAAPANHAGPPDNAGVVAVEPGLPLAEQAAFKKMLGAKNHFGKTLFYNTTLENLQPGKPLAKGQRHFQGFAIQNPPPIQFLVWGIT